jgi:hypothetical protein
LTSTHPQYRIVPAVSSQLVKLKEKSKETWAKFGLEDTSAKLKRHAPSTELPSVRIRPGSGLGTGPRFCHCFLLTMKAKVKVERADAAERLLEAMEGEEMSESGYVPETNDSASDYESEVEVKTEPESESEVEIKTEPESEDEVEIKIEPESESEAEAKAKLWTNAQ